MNYTQMRLKEYSFKCSMSTFNPHLNQTPLTFYWHQNFNRKKNHTKEQINKEEENKLPVKFE